jgi:adenylosuccinate lyase
MNFKKPGFMLLCAAAAALAAQARWMSVQAADPAHERHEAMEAVGSAFKPLVAMAKKETPFDVEVVHKNATTIADKLKEASTLFPAGSGGGESRAKPEIWSDADGFAKSMKDAQAAAVALQSIKDEEEFRPAFGTVGTSCRDCHEKYRLPRK